MKNTKAMMTAGVVSVAMGAGLAVVAFNGTGLPQCVMRPESGPPEGCLRKDAKTGKFTWESPNVVFPAVESSGSECLPVPCPAQTP